ncbi:MAG: hypothetical protein HYZ69_01130, partial [Candidatus Colwellbacteria bacterium]|nr:hypothetical protein [Candidatus Colwellbacteria bacterium]
DLELSLKLPDGSVLVNGNGKKVAVRELGEIDVGGVHQEIFRIMATPQENGSREFLATLSYSPGSIAARFEKSRSITVEVAPIGVELGITAPEKTFSGEEFETVITYKPIVLMDSEPPKLSLKMLYPDKFTKNSEVASKDAQSGQKLTVKGRVDFPDNASFEIKAQVVTNLIGDDYVVAEKTAKILMSPSPLSLKVDLNGTPGFIANPGDTLNYVLTYKNNTSVDLQDIFIRTRLTGEMFDFASLNTNGAKFNSFDKTITWDSAAFSGQAVLKPDEERNVPFTVKVRDNFPIRRLNDKNFTLNAVVRIESPTVPYLISADKTVNSAVLETKVSGMVAIDTRAYFRDAASGILNKGLWPPKVGTPTQFTIHLLLTNFASDIKDVEVRASLADGTTFTGVVKSNTSTAPELNTESGEIVWKIDKLVATTGITGEKPEAIFQVEATPTPDKKGSYVAILGVIGVKAYDEFTGREINNSHAGITTRLSDDSSVAEGEGIVVE